MRGDECLQVVIILVDNRWSDQEASRNSNNHCERDDDDNDDDDTSGDSLVAPGGMLPGEAVSRSRANSPMPDDMPVLRPMMGRRRFRLAVILEFDVK